MSSALLLEVLPAADVPEGESVAAEVDGRRLLVTHGPDGWYVTGADCTHAGAPLETGTTLGCLLVCPWHDAVFDLRDGAVERGPARRALRTYPVTVIDGVVCVAVTEEA